MGHRLVGRLAVRSHSLSQRVKCSVLSSLNPPVRGPATLLGSIYYPVKQMGVTCPQPPLKGATGIWGSASE